MRGLKGAATTIEDVSKMVGLLWPSKWEAVHNIILANFQRYAAYGQGNKAERRKQRMEEIREAEELSAWYDQQALTVQDVDSYAATHEI